jgi:hypothetical protein
MNRAMCNCVAAFLEMVEAGGSLILLVSTYQRRASVWNIRLGRTNGGEGEKSLSPPFLRLLCLVAEKKTRFGVSNLKISLCSFGVTSNKVWKMAAWGNLKDRKTCDFRGLLTYW